MNNLIISKRLLKRQLQFSQIPNIVKNETLIFDFMYPLYFCYVNFYLISCINMILPTRLLKIL